MEQPLKTVKVRIAVVVDAKGNWNASGWKNEHGEGEGEAMNICVDGVDDGGRRFWVETELPIPKIETFPVSTIQEEGK